MSAFSETALEKKLLELSSSQQSVQTLSLWLIHHRKHSKTIVTVWNRELKKAKAGRKLTFLYLANDVIQNSKRKGPEFTKDFAPVIVDAFKHVASLAVNDSSRLAIILNIPAILQGLDILWNSRNVMEELGMTMELIKALQELENAASGDAAVRHRISALPLEVQDVSLLGRIADKDSGDRLSRMVDDACMLLADYSGRLAAEIDDRKQLTRMLTDFLRAQKEILTEKEQKLEDYKQKLAKVSQVRKELRSRISSLPDLSLLPNVTGDPLQLPSSGDLYSAD
ncbi:RPR1A protein, partial [Polypterus senegalus]